MLIQVNTDRNVQGSEELKQRLTETIRSELARFEDRLTRVEIHLGDVNSDKKGGGDDIRCLLEARPAGLDPVAVKHQAPNVDLAVDGALDKFRRAFESAIGKQAKR